MFEVDVEIVVVVVVEECYVVVGYFGKVEFVDYVVEVFEVDV